MRAERLRLLLRDKEDIWAGLLEKARFEEGFEKVFL